jgi:hypothetical protein
MLQSPFSNLPAIARIDAGDRGVRQQPEVNYQHPSTNGGGGVAEDKKEAVRWYRLSADQGNASAQFSLEFYPTIAAIVCALELPLECGKLQNLI